MVQDIVFAMMMAAAVAAGIVTVVHEFGGRGKSSSAEEAKTPESKEKEGDD